MFWVALFFLAVFLGALTWLFFYVCGRRRVPDYWEEAELARRGYTALKDGVLAGKAWLGTKYTRDVWIASDDDLRLHGVLVPQRGARGTILLFHGYHSSWKLDFSCQARFLYEQGFQLLFVEERAHGQSGGRCITYGVWERFDARSWTLYAAERFGPAHPLFLYGLSMGASVVLMAAGLELPGNVRGIIADCGFTSPYDIIGSVFTERTGLPAPPFLALLNGFTNAFVGFGLRDCDTVDAVKETEYPILLIHGTADRFVPCEMSRRTYDACGLERELLLVEGAGHAMSYLTDRERVEEALRRFLDAHASRRDGRKPTE